MPPVVNRGRSRQAPLGDGVPEGSKMFGLIKNKMRNALAAVTRFKREEPRKRFAGKPSAIGGARTAGSANDGRSLYLPLAAILRGLRPEFKARFQRATAVLDVPIPYEKILPQLSNGAVRISFGELRQAAPGAFSSDADLDELWVALPLADIVARLDPRLVRCHRAQGRAQIPDDMPALFGGDLAGPPLTQAPAPAEQPANLGEAREFSSAPTPPPPAVPTGKIHGRDHQAPVPVGRTSPLASIPPAVPPAAPAAVLQPVPAPSSPGLRINLSMLCQDWPAPVLEAAALAGLTNATLDLPLDVVEQGLKRGKLAYSWKTLRGWIVPAMPPTTSPHDSEPVILPLSIVAPAFLALQGKSKRKQKFIVDQSIPDLFCVNEPPKPAETETLSTPAASTSDCAAREGTVITPVTATAPAPRALAGGERPSEAPLLTPEDLVARAAALPGVAGALVALGDGLPVASRLTSPANADTLAVFVPEIYNRVSEGIQEFHPGELNRLCFNLGNIPWEIYRVRKVFFAAYGQADKPFPEETLTALAKQLNSPK